MNVVVRRIGDVAVLELSGKILGGAESNVLRDELDRALARGESRLVLDLQEVPWMNSAGLGILLSAYSRLKERGGAVCFCGVGRRVQGILKTTKLLTVLDVFDDVQSGIRSFESETSAPSADTDTSGRDAG